MGETGRPRYNIGYQFVLAGYDRRGKGLPTRSELRYETKTQIAYARKRLYAKLESKAFGKRHPRIACERGGGAAVNIIETLYVKT